MSGLGLSRPLLPKVREVLKRAGAWDFPCLICGKRPVEIDHTVMYGGRRSDDLLDLAPFCADCHRGEKSSLLRPLRNACSAMVRMMGGEDSVELRRRIMPLLELPKDYASGVSERLSRWEQEIRVSWSRERAGFPCFVVCVDGVWEEGAGYLRRVVRGSALHDVRKGKRGVFRLPVEGGALDFFKYVLGRGCATRFQGAEAFFALKAAQHKNDSARLEKVERFDSIGDFVELPIRLRVNRERRWLKRMNSGR